MTEEIWRPVVGWEGIYSVSNQGNVRSEDRVVEHSKSGSLRLSGTNLAKTPNSRSGHYTVRLYRNGRGKTFFVHSLVATSFIGPRPEGMEVCHNDGNPLNNSPENLRYDTSSSNLFDRVSHGVHHMAVKTHCKNGHPLEFPNLDLNKLEKHGRRQCLACCRTASRFYSHPDLRPHFKKLSDDLYYSKYKVEGMEVVECLNLSLPQTD